MDLEAEEGVEDIKTKGVDPISKLSDYIPLRKGKVKVPKDRCRTIPPQYTPVTGV